jgi:miniconductance mechanosensitive channel
MPTETGTLTPIRPLVTDWLAAHGVGGTLAEIAATVAFAVVVAALCVLVNYIAKGVLVTALHRIAARTQTEWDDHFVRRRVFTKLSHIAPALIIYSAAGLFGSWGDTLQNFAVAYMGFCALLVVGSALDAVVDIYRTYEISRDRPIQGYVQAAKIFLFVVGGIAVFATLINQSPWKLLSGIGALTAIILLIFKDTILGFVAGIQLSANDMVRIGDWIEAPKFGADGDVMDITLHHVKVQNWDKTISTIPTYALVGDSFRNWRGMQDSGGRRIKRSINIDMNSVSFCTDEQLDRFARFAFVGPYVAEKRAELVAWNDEHAVDMSEAVNGRRITNLGTFRAYIRAYLRNHPMVHQDMTLLVRHRPPTEHGLPIELYIFTNDIVWANYEGIQADIFDHVLAVIPEFGLRVHQAPSGLDLREAVGAYTDRA